MTAAQSHQNCDAAVRPHSACVKWYQGSAIIATGLNKPERGSEGRAHPLAHALALAVVIIFASSAVVRSEGCELLVQTRTLPVVLALALALALLLVPLLIL